MGLNLNPFFLIGGAHWKGVIIWLHRKGGDLKDTQRNTQNAAIKTILRYSL